MKYSHFFGRDTSQGIRNMLEDCPYLKLLIYLHDDFNQYKLKRAINISIDHHFGKSAKNNCFLNVSEN